MQRRSFLSSALRAGVASGLASQATRAKAQTVGDAQRSGSAFPVLPPALIGPEAESQYFSESALAQALGTATLQKPAVEVIAYNFPAWHPSPFMEARFGKGWTEFDTLRNARPLFPGHTMPHYPLWGYYDEADPAWAAREIDLAADHGVHAWLIDWYWHNGTQFYQEQLEQGMLHAPNRDRLQFAIMWANHDWKNVYPARSPDQAAVLLAQTHSVADCERVADYCAEHYWSQPNYLRIGSGDGQGAPLFAIFDCGKLVEQLGQDGTKRALAAMRERAHRHGFPAVHLQVCNGYDKFAAHLQALGFDSATQYGTFGWTYGVKPPGARIPYGVGAREAIASWAKTRATLSIPFHPCCQVGWDDSPRFEDDSAVAVDRSPDQFERLVRAGRHTTAETADPRLLYVAAWNEWTEDHVLLPDSIWGYSYLEALRRGAHG